MKSNVARADEANASGNTFWAAAKSVKGEILKNRAMLSTQLELLRLISKSISIHPKTLNWSNELRFFTFDILVQHSGDLPRAAQLLYSQRRRLKKKAHKIYFIVIVCIWRMANKNSHTVKVRPHKWSKKRRRRREVRWCHLKNIVYGPKITHDSWFSQSTFPLYPMHIFNWILYGRLVATERKKNENNITNNKHFYSFFLNQRILWKIIFHKIKWSFVLRILVSKLAEKTRDSLKSLLWLLLCYCRLFAFKQPL